MFEKLNLGFKKSKFEKDKDVSKIKNIEFQIPLVNAKDGDNGIMYYGKKQDFDTATMTIDIVNDGAVSTGNVYPQPQETGVLYNAYLIKSKFDISKNLLFFFATTIQKSIKLKFSYELKASWERVKNENIKLPITQNGEIDFDFMESFISEIEEGRVCELEAYLKVAGLTDTTLTQAEQKAIEAIGGGYELNSKTWKEFRIGDLFDVYTGRDVIINQVKDGVIPLISHKNSDNGVSKYIQKLNNRILFDFKNTISLADRGVFCASTQKENFYIGTRVKALKFKSGDKSLNIRLFFVTSINKLQNLFLDYSANATDDLPNLNIKLPVTASGEIDFEFMESFISGVQKISIKGVIGLKDKIIEQTKKAI